MATQDPPLEVLDDELWGERVHRAYRRARRYRSVRGPDGQWTFSYRAVARRLMEAGVAANEQTLVRLEWQEEPPSKLTTYRAAYFAVVGYGYDPVDFGLDPDRLKMPASEVRRISRLVNPNL